MKAFTAFFIFLFAASFCEADMVKARGAAPRKHFTAARVDVDDVIRAEDDPNFLQYLKEKERQEKLNDKALEEAAKQRRADEAAYEKARREYIAEENRRPAQEYAKQEAEYRKEELAYEKQQEKYRREYVAQQRRQEEKEKRARVARMQKAFGPSGGQIPVPERMPASN